MITTVSVSRNNGWHILESDVIRTSIKQEYQNSISMPFKVAFDMLESTISLKETTDIGNTLETPSSLISTLKIENNVDTCVSDNKYENIENSEPLRISSVEHVPQLAPLSCAVTDPIQVSISNIFGIVFAYLGTEYYIINNSKIVVRYLSKEVGDMFSLYEHVPNIEINITEV